MRSVPYLCYSLLSISVAHLTAFFLNNQMMAILAQLRTANPVNIHPGPMASIKGCMTTTATQASVFRRILFKATPVLALPGNNSVSMVEVMLKTKLLPRPKKKVARHCGFGGDQFGLPGKQQEGYLLEKTRRHACLWSSQTIGRPQGK